VTNEQGVFVFPAIQPGKYDVLVSAVGFKTSQIDGFDIHVAMTGVLLVTLELGTINETIAVALEVGESHAAVGTVVDARMLTALPSINRNALEAAAIAPGVDVLGGVGQVIGVDGGAVLAHGHRRSQNSYYVDGAENAGAWRNSALQTPNPDAIQEVRIHTANAGVQFGKQPGAAINVVTRSGTNRFQGTAFYFAHDERLNANSWTNNRNGLPKPPDNQRSIGGVLGGPIQRQRTFFFVSFNRYQNNLPVTQQAGRFPTLAMKTGDFSEVPGFVRPDGSVVPFNIKDPVTGVSLGATVPLDRQSFAARRLLELLPTAGTYYETAVRQFERPTTNDETVIKIDHLVGRDQRLTGLLMHTRGREVDPSQGFAANTAPAWGELRRLGRQTTASVTHSWPVNTQWVLESRLAMAQSSSNIVPRDQSLGPQDVGIAFPWTPPIRQLPGLRLEAQSGFRADHATTDYIGQRNYRLGATAVRASGSHLLKFGGETQVDTVRFEVNRELRTSFTFTGRDTLNGPIGPSDVPLSANDFGVQNFAYAWADFLMGRVTSFSTGGYVQTESAFRSSYVFAEDEWRPHQTLTITAGVRYELAGDMHERYGQFGGVFVAGHQSSRFPNAPAGLAWPGDEGIPEAVLRRDRNDIAPQIGVTYDPSRRAATVLRGAVGKLYSMIPLASRINAGTSGYGGAFLTGANALLDNPYLTAKINPYDLAPQYGPGVPLPDPMIGYSPATFPWESLFTTQTVRGLPTRVFSGNLVGFDPAVETPSSLQVSASVEHRLRPWWVASAGYVGARGRHQPMWRALNAPIPEPGANLSPQSLRDRQPLPAYGAGRLYATVLQTQYDALELRSSMRHTLGALETSYVLSRAMSPFGVNATGADAGDVFGFSTGSASAEAILDTANGVGQASYPYDVERDRAEVGRRHVLKIHSYAAVPMLSGEGWSGGLAGGWTIAAVFAAASGLPLNVLWGLDANADGSAADRPNLIAAVRYPRAPVADTSFDRRGAIQYIDPGTFTGPCGNSARSGPDAFCPTPGNLRRNAVRGVPVFNLDVAVAKKIFVSSAKQLEVRVESFNVTNSNFLDVPTLTLASPFFGQVVGRLHRPRRTQLGVKFYF
jgi:hypothetical protein